MSFSFVKVCPECGGEFQETTESCPDCGVPLVVKPPEGDHGGMSTLIEPPQPISRPPEALPLPPSSSHETVVETSLEHTKGLMAALADAGIRFRVERLRPPDTRSLSPAFGIPADAGSYAVRVGATDLSAAREVWDRYFRSQVPEGFSEPREGSCPGCGSFLTTDRTECPECGLTVS